MLHAMKKPIQVCCSGLFSWLHSHVTVPANRADSFSDRSCSLLRLQIQEGEDSWASIVKNSQHQQHRVRASRAEMLPSTASPVGAAALTQPQLRQMRAQCLVFLAFKNQMEPRKRHLEIALGEDEIDGAGCHGETTTTTSSPSQASSSSAAPLPLPHLLPISSLRLSPPVTEQENLHRNDDPEAEHE
ncbi:hypothetical protein ACQJBY_012733 [Aegilops geniculata]